MRISDWSSDVCSSDLSSFLFSAFVGAVVYTLFEACRGITAIYAKREIGRASCRESVSVRVDLGGRRIIKKKNTIHDDSNELRSRQLTHTTKNSLNMNTLI